MNNRPKTDENKEYDILKGIELQNMNQFNCEMNYEKTLIDIMTDLKFNSKFDEMSRWCGFVLLD